MDINEAIQIVKSNWPDERYTMLRQALTTLIDCPDAIRAEARAEAAQIVCDERDCYRRSNMLVFDSSVLAAFDRAEAAILADEPKEREAEAER